MALLHPILLGSSAAGGFEVERSLRFNAADDASLKRTPSSTGNQRTWTWSGWIKRSSIDSHNAENAAVFADARGSIETTFGFLTSNQFYLDIGGRNATTALFRDVSAWQHWVIAIDTTQSSSGDRVKIYVNGVRITAFDQSHAPSQNYDTGFNMQQLHNIGRYADSESYQGGHFDGYIAEINLIDGQQLTPTSFGEFDSVTNQWNPIDTSSLTFGTNGYRLQFLDNSGTSATTLGKDTSGNGNNYTPQNFSVSSGQGDDSVEDTPTNNYPTINFLNSREPDRISNGGLDIDYTDSDDNVASVATFAIDSGKYYFEVLLRAGSSSVLSSLIGVAPDSYLELKRNNANAWPGKDTDSGVGIDGSGAKYVDGNSSTYGSSFTTNDVVGVAVDADAKKVAFSKNGQFSDGNGSYNQGANVASGGQVTIDGTGPYFPVFADTSSSRNPQFTLNFGQRAFSHSIPSGYQKLNSQNLPACTVDNPKDYHNTVIYTGNRTARSITGVGFQPDWVWIKDLGGSQNNAVFDAVRGANVQIRPDTTGGDITAHSNTLTSFDSDGFSLGNDMNVGDVNYDLQDHAAWCWYAGGSTATNSNGSISTQVRADTASGFSICTWTGNGSSGATIGHGLGVAPNFCFIKRRDAGGNNWIAASFDEESARELNTGNGFSTGDYDAFFTSQPTSTTVTMGTDDNNNRSGGTYVGYFFANTYGYSKAGLYKGNGASNGAFIYTGFRPAWVIYKLFSGSDDGWYIQDSVRSPENVTKVSSRVAAVPQSGENIGDMLSNGFKIRIGGNGNFNANGSTYIYLAFAEAPFKNARAR